MRHPKLTRAFLRFNNHLLFSSTLPPRLREVAVLRVAHLHHCEYEWQHHVRMGRETGLTDEDIDGIQRSEAADDLDHEPGTGFWGYCDPACTQEHVPR